jgi:hypothetical protein
MKLELETLTDITVAIFTAGAVFVSLYLARKSQQHEAKAQHKQRVSDVGTKMIEQLAELRAAVIPYWEDEKEKNKNLVSVHKSVELIVAHQYQMTALLDNKTFSDSTPTTTEDLRATFEMAEASAKCLYLTLVNDAKTWAGGADVKKEFIENVPEKFHNRTEAFIKNIEITKSSNHYADQLTEKSLYEIEAKLSAYVTSL